MGKWAQRQFIISADSAESKVQLYSILAREHTHERTHTMFSGADNPGELPAHYCEFQLSVRVHTALVVSCHVQMHMEEGLCFLETHKVFRGNCSIDLEKVGGGNSPFSPFATTVSET